MALGLSAFAFAQKTYVTGTLPVKVEERTLFYNGAGFEVSSADATVHNQGNIQVATGDFKVVNNTNRDNFHMYWQSKGIGGADGVNIDLGYGQLIINEAVAVDAASKIRIDKQVPGGDIIDNVPRGFPFTGDDTAVMIINHPDNVGFNFSNNNNRLFHPLYRWNNKLMRWDRKSKDGPITNWHYYIIRNAGGMQEYNPDSATPIRTHIGTPSNIAVVRSMFDHSALPDFTSTGSVNYYNEVYKSYIDEYFEDQPAVIAGGNMAWGKNQYQYGNPYTSNIDLGYIGFDEEAAGAFYDENGNGVLDAGEELNDNNVIAGLIGVYQHVGGNEVNPVYGQEPNIYSVDRAVAVNGVFTSGDRTALIVKPMDAFVVKTDGSAMNSMNFNDGLKTFAYRSKAEDLADGSGEVAYKSFNNSTFGTDYYQLRMSLSDNSSFINRGYVIAQSELVNGVGGIAESNHVDELVQGLYTRQELAEGEGVDPLQEKQLYINQINTDYMGVPIPIYMSNLEEGANYHLDFDLCLGINDLLESQLSYENTAAKYYFHDIYNDVYFEIFNNSSYDFVKLAGDGSAEGNRFELFFGAMSEDLGLEDIESAVETTQLYSSDKEHYIKFDKEWNKANISVYTAVGQIVFMKEDVSTENDFLLPLNEANTTTYIVKIENPETGEAVSKKVIK